MVYNFEDQVGIEKQVGVGLNGDYVYCWLTRNGDRLIQIRVLRAFAEDRWGIDRWQDELSVAAAMRLHRNEFRDLAIRASNDNKFALVVG